MQLEGNRESILTVCSSGTIVANLMVLLACLSLVKLGSMMPVKINSHLISPILSNGCSGVFSYFSSGTLKSE